MADVVTLRLCRTLLTGNFCIQGPMPNFLRNSFVGLALVSLAGYGCSASSGAPITSVSSAGGSSGGDGAAGADGSAVTDGSSSDVAPTALNTAIQNIVIIYAENRTFDNMFGNFPGAHGLSEVVDDKGAPTSAYVAQKDRDGTTALAKLPKTWGGVTL